MNGNRYTILSYVFLGLIVLSIKFHSPFGFLFSAWFAMLCSVEGIKKAQSQINTLVNVLIQILAFLSLLFNIFAWIWLAYHWIGPI